MPREAVSGWIDQLVRGESGFTGRTKGGRRTKGGTDEQKVAGTVYSSSRLAMAMVFHRWLSA